MSKGERRFRVMRRDLPYGVWLTADRREILFNRNYQPIWERREGEPAHRADPGEWIDWSRQNWFYNDGSAPFYCPEKEAELRALLKAWGVPADALAELDALMPKRRARK